jgi:hypothetical protein
VCGRAKTPALEDNGVAKRPWSERINNITQTCLHDFIDIMVFLTLGALLGGAGVAAAVNPVVRSTDSYHAGAHTPSVSLRPAGHWSMASV